jgi:hypothetical protein
LVALKPPSDAGSLPIEPIPVGSENGTKLTAQRPVLQPASQPGPQGKPDLVLDKGLEIARQIVRQVPSGKAR